MIPLFLLKLVGGRKLVAWAIVGVIAAAVVGGIAWVGATVKDWHDSHVELAVVKPKLKAFEDAQTKANEKVKEQAPVDAADVKELVETKAALEASRAETSRAWGQVAALKETINAETGCPVIRLSAGWGVCFAAAAAGDPADIAACQAAGSDGAVPTGAGNGGL